MNSEQNAILQNLRQKPERLESNESKTDSDLDDSSGSIRIEILLTTPNLPKSKKEKFRIKKKNHLPKIICLRSPNLCLKRSKSLQNGQKKIPNLQTRVMRVRSPKILTLLAKTLLRAIPWMMDSKNSNFKTNHWATRAKQNPQISEIKITQTKHSDWRGP